MLQSCGKLQNIYIGKCKHTSEYQEEGAKSLKKVVGNTWNGFRRSSRNPFLARLVICHGWSMCSYVCTWSSLFVKEHANLGPFVQPNGEQAWRPVKVLTENQHWPWSSEVLFCFVLVSFYVVLFGFDFVLLCVVLFGVSFDWVSF